MPISNLVSPTRILRQGMSGPAITAAQLAMKQMGYQLGGSGYFGPATAVAVRTIQQRAGLKADGEIGPATAKVIDDAVARLTGAAKTSGAATQHDATPVGEISRPLWLEAGLQLINVHEVPGSADNPEIIQWAQELGGDIAKEYKHDSIPWCFIGETEIMTERGFVRFDRLVDGERVYQADEDGNLSIAPSILVTKDYNGDVFDITTRSIRLTCDVGHRWYGKWLLRTDRQEFRSLDQITTAGLRIPPVYASGAGVGLSDDQIRLVAAFIADGKNRNGAGGKPWSIDFEVSKKRKIAALTALCPAHIYVQKMAYGPLTKTPLTVFRFLLPEFFEAIFEDYKVLSPIFINALNAHQARIFLEAYATFDGDAGKVVYTSNKRMCDDLTMIGVMAGYHPSVQKRLQGSELSDAPSWKISFGDKDSREIRPKHLTRRNFSGKLYCVSVPEQRIVVRGPNGTPVLTGNCALFANHCLAMAGLPGTNSLWALDFAGNWPSVKLVGAAVGSFAPMTRAGGGHIIQIVGKDRRGNYMGLGGNQSDAVNIMAFPPARLNKGFWWPKSVPIPQRIGLSQLPVVTTQGKLSTKES